GEVLGLVGESGSGKTTVALALLGHARRGLRISGGEVLLDGTDLLRLSPGDLRAARGAKVAYVPQDPSAALNPAQRVGTQLRGGAEGPPGRAGGLGCRGPGVMAEARPGPTPEKAGPLPPQVSGGQAPGVSLGMGVRLRPVVVRVGRADTGLDV